MIETGGIESSTPRRSSGSSSADRGVGFERYRRRRTSARRCSSIEGLRRRRADARSGFRIWPEHQGADARGHRHGRSWPPCLLRPQIGLFGGGRSSPSSRAPRLIEVVRSLAAIPTGGTGDVNITTATAAQQDEGRLRDRCPPLPKSQPPRVRGPHGHLVERGLRRRAGTTAASRTTEGRCRAAPPTATGAVPGTGRGRGDADLESLKGDADLVGRPTPPRHNRPASRRLQRATHDAGQMAKASTVPIIHVNATTW